MDTSNLVTLSSHSEPAHAEQADERPDSGCCCFRSLCLPSFSPDLGKVHRAMAHTHPVAYAGPMSKQLSSGSLDLDHSIAMVIMFPRGKEKTPEILNKVKASFFFLVLFVLRKGLTV